MSTSQSGFDPASLVKKLVDNLQNDYRNISNEAKRKHSNVKEAAENGIVKVRNLSSKSDDVLTGKALQQESVDFLQPLILGCETKNPKLVQLSLVGIQRLISHRVVSDAAAATIISCLWGLMESGVEELKLLQTILLLLTSTPLVHGASLSKALVLCFRLHFTKDSTTINTASATVRQLVALVFERMTTEDKIDIRVPVAEVNPEELKTCGSVPPKSLHPSASDAFLLFQDLVQLVNADQPFWLVGLTEMTRTFGLELMEAVLSAFPEIFFQHPEFSFLLKERVCPLIIKLFSPNLKYRQGSQSSAAHTMAVLDKPYFPISVRLLRIVSVLIQKYHSLLVTECEIFLSLVVKFLEGDKPHWQRALALEVLHRMVVQSDILKSFCVCYDMKPHSTKIFQDIVNSLGDYIQSLFITPQSNSGIVTSQSNSGSSAPLQNQVGSIPSGVGMAPQPGFLYRGIWIPLSVTLPTGLAKAPYLESLDKLEPPFIIDGYGLSLAFACLLDVVVSINLVLGAKNFEPGQQMGDEGASSGVSDFEANQQLINSSWCGLLAAFCLLLDASTDESPSESILKAIQTFAGLCGQLQMTIPRDAFVTALCKASLPPHYALTILSTSSKTDQMTSGHGRNPSQDFMNGAGSVSLPTVNPYVPESEFRQQVVVVGTPLPTTSLPASAQQGPVMLTAKNLQCMRALLGLALCHGSVLGSAWHMVLTTLQHLAWILGMKPSTGGSLRAGRVPDGPNGPVITTAVTADLPVLSAMLSRLFENSRYLDEVALHHLINALCQLSQESMEMAYTNREPSLFAVAKLLETGLMNLGRLDAFWRAVTNHLLEVCQHPHSKLREWGTEAIAMLVRAALEYQKEPPLKEDAKMQALVLAPLRELSAIPHPDVRQKQLDCILQVLHGGGESLSHSWPLVLDIVGALLDNHGESLARMAFQCLQLVITDFLPVMPPTCLRACLDTVARFGSQGQELNVSLSAVGLMWNISDYLYQNQNKIKEELVASPDGGKAPMSPFDGLWMCHFTWLGELCVNPHPAVRKSAGQTLFSTIGAHGGLLQPTSWQAVLWQVLFPLLDRVRTLSGSASTDKTDMGGNILVHHSRNTAQKQWSETQVLTLSGAARVFNTKRELLQRLGDFPRAWTLLLEFIEGSATSKNNEVSLAALKSFQELVQPCKMVCEDQKCTDTDAVAAVPQKKNDSAEETVLWSAAGKVWYKIGIESTLSPSEAAGLGAVYVPTQPFLTALMQIFPPLFFHIKHRFSASDLQKLSTVLLQAVTVPVHGEASPFILTSLTEITVTPLQESVLQVLELLQNEALSGNEVLKSMIAAFFNLLLSFVKFSCHAPTYGKLQTRNAASAKPSATDWVTMNYVPFAERVLQMTVSLYQITANEGAVIKSRVLHDIIKTLRIPLSLRYSCPSQTTWKLSLDALLTVIGAGLPVAKSHCADFSSAWLELAATLEEFLFPATPPVANQTLEDSQFDEAIDCKVVQMICTKLLPNASSTPKEFILKIVALLNRGSIHSATSSVAIEPEMTVKLREEFARLCFETLLQYSFLSAGSEPSEVEDGVTGRLAVAVLLHRFQEVLHRYTEDERLSGKCPLPRHRMAEVSFVLKALSTLTAALKKAPPQSVSNQVWIQLIDLYPYLVECTTSPSPQLGMSLKEALREYKDLMAPPKNQLYSANPTPNGL